MILSESLIITIRLSHSLFLKDRENENLAAPIADSDFSG
jgi:hypothetical protein